MSRYDQITVPLRDEKKAGTTVHKRLKYDANALVLLEETLGWDSALSFLSDPALVRQKLGFRAIRALVWAGLHGAGLQLPVEEVGDRMILSSLGEYTTATTRALSLAMTGKLPSKEVEAVEEPTSDDPTETPSDQTAQ